MSMLGLGIDPGPTMVGYALIDFTVPSSPVWYGGGSYVLGEQRNSKKVVIGFGTQQKLLRMLLDKYRPDFFAIEKPRAMNKPEANVQAMATSWSGGRLSGMAEWAGLEVYELGVTEWRSEILGGRPKKGDNVDHRVKEWLERVVRQFPKTNVHARDAGGVLCVAGRRHAIKLRMGLVGT